MVIMPDELPTLLKAAAHGDTNAKTIMSLIISWFKQTAAITEPNKIPLCLACDTALVHEAIFSKNVHFV
jgi:hypothetical protein